MRCETNLTTDGMFMIKRCHFSRKPSILILFLLLTTLGRADPPTQLKGVTYGFGAGYHHSLSRIYDYFLLPDDNYKLNITNQPRGSFVISSMINIKVRKLVNINGALKRAVGSETLLITNPIKKFAGSNERAVTTTTNFVDPNWKDLITFHIGLNLAEIAPTVTFNKKIDGGIGIGYLLSENSHIVLMCDFTQIRKMRDHYVDTYNGKSIPNGSGFLTTLNVDDNNLFKTKTTAGLSLKLVFTI
jgi:hypothetical protein